MLKGSIIAFTLIVCALFALPRMLKRNRIRQWRKLLRIDHCLAIYKQIFVDIDGFRLSQQARAGKNAMEYVYGEIEFTSFIALLSLTHPNQQTIFYDLGSGVGKAVIACALVFDVKKSCGIELFVNLHKAADQCRQRLNLYSPHKADVIQFLHSDFLTADFHEATLIFINASALFGETWEHLNQRVELLTPPGVIIITTSKKLRSPDFFTTHITPVQMSWGVVQAYIQRRKTCINTSTAN